MDERRGRPPWVWSQLSGNELRQRWQELVAWVEWIEEAYAPWVTLPACWPAHEGLRNELVLLWYWYDWLVHEESDPVAALRWHTELRRAATAWRELATCDHRSPGTEYERIRAAHRVRRDQFVAEVLRAQEPLS